MGDGLMGEGTCLVGHGRGKGDLYFSCKWDDIGAVVSATVCRRLLVFFSNEFCLMVFI